MSTHGAQRGRRWAAIALGAAALLAGGLGGAAWLGGCGHTTGAGLEWRATCEVDSVQVGDLVAVRLDGRWPAARQQVHLRWGLPGDTLLVGRLDSLEVEADEGWTARRYQVALIVPRAGRIPIPPAALVAAGGETLAVTEPVELAVGGRVDPQAQTPLKPLAPLVRLRSFPWWLVGLVGVLLAAAFVFWWLRGRRAVAVTAAAGPPPPPPGEEFRTALEALLKQDLAERGRIRDFAQELSWILRRYLGRRWEQPALEATRPEILRWLPDTDLTVGEQQKLAAWLEETDAIKFAGRLPLLAGARALVEEANGVVRRGEEIAAERARRAAEAAAAQAGASVAEHGSADAGEGVTR